MDNEDFREVKLALDSLSVYRQLLENQVVSNFYNLMDCLSKEPIEPGRFLALYNDFFLALAETSVSWRDYITSLILYDVNSFTRQAEALNVSNSLFSAAQNDLDSLEQISGVRAVGIKEYAQNYFAQDLLVAKKIAKLPEWMKEANSPFFHRPWTECIKELQSFYHQNGTGIFARYRAFIWEKNGTTGALKGIKSPDPIKLTDLIDYEIERGLVIENTRHFLEGYPANNMLLYGDRGTGKSSTVKALLNEYYTQGLRMIEVPKRLLVDFPEIISRVREEKLKFIIFVDDLSFEDSEESYTALKAVLEGGLESKPKNVLIYATSNRRHLIKETFSERAGMGTGNYDDEVRAADTMQEKLSLADRFGITVVFTSPDKRGYLAIVEGLAAQRSIDIDRAQLHKEALLWELKYNARSPRTARQFVDWLEGQVATTGTK